MIDPALERAYWRTTYLVDHPSGPIALRVGENNLRLDALLHAADYETWAFVSACNPRSRPLAQVENTQRHAALLARVRRLALPFFPGRGVADDGGWFEESLLILGVAPADAVALGNAFGQNAVVLGRVGGVAELRWCAQ